MRKLNPSEPVVSANAVPSARKARTKTSDKAPGARAAKHSKAVVEEPANAPSVAAPAETAPAAATPLAEEPVIVASVVEETVIVPPAITVSHEEIARLAYCYWMDRGCQGGSAHEDWVRAEQALLAMTAAK